MQSSPLSGSRTNWRAASENEFVGLAHFHFPSIILIPRATTLGFPKSAKNHTYEHSTLNFLHNHRLKQPFDFSEIFL
jgi:hypothetical protein